jgi:AraC family transcriptional regulator of adaptative response/methylated-DNA-[protein]-cysteine methyltransferase
VLICADTLILRSSKLERRIAMTTSVTHEPANEAREVLHYAVGKSTLGCILVASSDKGIAAILIGDSPRVLAEELRAGFPNALLRSRSDDRLVQRVVGLIEDPAVTFDLPLDVRGTPFQQKVWTALRNIPVGVTTTYSDLAARIGDPKAVRAVASACASNRLAVAIPCHRVLRNDGSLSGYRWGVQRKRSLIEREAASVRMRDHA